MRVLFFSILFFSQITFASLEYMNGTPTPITKALEDIYGAGAGVGTTNCNLCHLTSSGGPGNLNLDFGADFTMFGGTGANMTVANLRSVFSAMVNIDSDGDGLLNGVEFERCSNPNDAASTLNACGGSSGANAKSSGCGFDPSRMESNHPHEKNQRESYLAMLLLCSPLGFLAGLRLKKN